jgi:membrane associated rhomboid family serine protease
MVIPLYDDNSDRVRFPGVNYALIAANVFVFVFLQQFGTNDAFTFAFALVPEAILTGKDVSGRQDLQQPFTGEEFTVHLYPTPVSPYLTLLTSMFLHGGFLHIAGNMLFLWIFGDNIEDALGHELYLVFYLVCGVLASLAHVLTTLVFHGDTMIPTLGASGAISGVLGAYILLFPSRQVVVLLFRFLTAVPAWVAIGMWFVFQLISGLGALGDPMGGGGVAYAAHVVGFLSGAVLIRPFLWITPIHHTERREHRGRPRGF